MDTIMRIGVLRPGPPAGVAAPVVAAAEARVITTECERRLGDISLDLRVDGDGVGPWLPVAHAAWPGDVDHVIAADDLWGTGLPPLTTLFARTVDPAAADVRRRMLHHLGILPLDRLDDGYLESWPPGGLRATDLWLIVTSADQVDTADSSLAAMTAAPTGDAAAALDEVFDRLAARFLTADDEHTDQRRLQRAEAALQSARAAAAEAADELRRAERESADLLDELRARLAVVDDRAERAELQQSIATEQS